ncbi:MAG: hypothetical protein GX926_04220 [Candidatus Magasanikbacteria bacterium]|nr:hypothetical protein [Candidatus Magasanikbacteria bacterium]
MPTQKEEQDIINAFNKIEGKLNLIPIDFCYWKEKIPEGILIKDKRYYVFYFRFIKDKQMQKNLAELRFCLDYYCSLFKLHKPKLTFEWHHRLVIFQVLGAIYEGILYDFISQKTNPTSKNIPSVIAKEKLNKRATGLATLRQIIYEAGTLNKSWNEYIIELANLRNTVHPKILNDQKTWFNQNSLVSRDNDILLKDLDLFIKYITPKY